MKIKPETLKQGAALMFGAVALAAYLTTVLWPSRPQSITTVSGPGASGDMVQVYLLDEDATLIPWLLEPVHLQPGQQGSGHRRGAAANDDRQ